MPISYTYDSLKDALKAWAEDDFTDYTDQLDDIIGKAESRLARDLDFALFDQVDGSSVTTTPSSATFDLADVGEGAFMLRQLWVNGALLEPKSESYVYYYGDLTSPGQPLYWAQTEGDTIRVAPTPDAAYSTRQIFARRQTSLSATQSSTFLSSQFGDLLFAAAQALSEKFDKAPEDEAAAWAEYERLLGPAKIQANMLRRKDYP